MFNRKKIKSVMVGILLVPLLLSGCNSSSTDSSNETGKEEQFVSTDSSTGTISLAVTNSRFAVGSTAGFTVTVRDVNGGPVSQVRIACDTERGLAIVEPTSGFELTDSSGSMSGRIGCEAPGSFQLACRLPIGGNKRKFATIVCTGDVPSDFTGFPSSGGGGLGGGVDTSDSEGDSDFAIRVTSVNFYDGGSFTTSSTSIDTTQGTCDDGSGEPFFDTSVGFEIVNNSQSVVRIESYTYTVANADGAGGSVTSGRLSFLGEAKSVDANGGATEVVALFLDANGSGKRYFGQTSNITALGFKNITFNIRGVDSAGNTINLTASASASLGTFDRCS